MKKTMLALSTTVLMLLSSGVVMAADMETKPVAASTTVMPDSKVETVKTKKNSMNSTKKHKKHHRKHHRKHKKNKMVTPVAPAPVGSTPAVRK